MNQNTPSDQRGCFIKKMGGAETILPLPYIFTPP